MFLVATGYVLWHSIDMFKHISGRAGSLGDILTKSRFLNGLQCPLFLWTQARLPERIPRPDAATARRFDAGDMVGELAKKVFPDGIDIPRDDFFGNIELAGKAMKKRLPIFEAGLFAGRVFSRVDILEPSGKTGWNIIEVKSSASVKDLHITDVAFQYFSAIEAGLSVNKCYLMHVNTGYVRRGDISPSEFFVREDVTRKAGIRASGIGKKVGELLKVLDGDRIPEKDIGEWCRSPYHCPMIKECWRFLPDHSVFDLAGAGKKAYELYRAGILAITDIPGGYPLKKNQIIQQKCEREGRPHADIKAINDFLSFLEYPLHFMDFETVNPAVPLYEGTSPFEQIPFQFSVFVVEKEGARAERRDFLAEGMIDPRPEFLRELKSALGPRGTVVAYNKSFENAVLRKLAVMSPEDADWVQDVISRTVDLLSPFKSFQYYHPGQKGKASIKNVLPALTGISYDGLEICEGGAASDAFLAIVDGRLSEKDKARTRAGLITYCGQDAEGMVRILEKLKKI
ncbi:MAG: DUF2779 domain-containing protein [Candidatus Omnitrophica bacterium]|nr:DUF2779 domain-containing protein [Candidatus Omnitrophota bacterium]